MRDVRRARRGASRHVVAALVAAGALVVGLAWWLERGAGGPAVPPAAVARTQTPARETPAASADLVDATPEPRAPAAAEAEPQVPSPANAARADAAPRDPVEVLVVEHGTGTPVAGAEVRWASWSEFGLATDPLRPRWSPDTEQLLSSARRTTTDEHGRATIDASVFPGRIAARRGDSFGWMHAHEVLPRPLRLEIAPERPISFLVVDADGRPVADAPVGLRKTPDRRLQGGFWSGTTDASGRATLRTLEVSQDSGTMYAALEILARDAPSVAIDLADPPREPIRLVMPDCGSLTVELRDAQGTLVLADSVGIGIDNSDPADKARWGQVQFDPEEIAVGSAHFPFVGVGLALEVYARRETKFVSTKARGPVAVGDEVLVELSTGPALVTIAGRIVDESGAPLVSRWMHFGVQYSGTSSSGESSHPFQTDAEGRFRLATPAEAGQPLRGTTTWLALGAGASGDARADLELDVPEAPVLLELGDVVVRLPAAIAGGLVVDDLGRPVAEAMLSVEAWSGAAGTWRQDSRYASRVAKDGRFTIRAVDRPERLRVRAARQNLVPGAFVEVAVGEQDARVVLPRASELAGTVLLGAGVAASSVEVRATPAGGGASTGPELDRMRTKVNDDGSFVLRGLQPGRVDVSFRSKGRKADLHTIEGVELPPGGRATDGRLDAIDLRGKFDAIDATRGGVKR